MEHSTTDIGSRIREARQLRGLTIRDISNTTKISTAALKAIEHNDFARLPGGVFSRAYVRAFAIEVGLDADELVRDYRSSVEYDQPAGPLPSRTVDWHEGDQALNRLPGVVITVGILIGGLVLLDRAQIPPDSPEDRPTLRAVEAHPFPEDTAPPAGPDATEDIALATTAASDTGAPSLQLEIQLRGLCWVSAVADGERVVYRLMQPGERTLIEGRTLIALRVGDAGAFAYAINGVPGRPLGGDGEVVTVSITSETLGRLSAAPVSAGPLEARRRLAL